jgi:guanyl-specific ribonuclease Sa
MSGRLAKSQVPIMGHSQLPPDAKRALIEAKNTLRRDLPFRTFDNQRGRTELEGPPLPEPSQGYLYAEFDVGQARPEDPKGERGTRRLVLEIRKSTYEILEIYFTPNHYEKFSFYRII